MLNKFVVDVEVEHEQPAVEEHENEDWLFLGAEGDSHAAHSAPKRKLLRLEHETRCKKCKEERSCCTCPPPNTRGRGRGRGRGPQYKNSSSSGSTESSSDDNSSV